MPFTKGQVAWNKGQKTFRDFNAYRRKYLLSHPWVKNWTSSKIRAKRLGRKHTLSVTDFKKLWIRDNAHLLKHPSIDRLDNKLGYIKGNCRFIERSLNSSLGNIGKKLSPQNKLKAIKNLHWYKK